MASKIEPARLLGHWCHSHEEGGAGRMVLRPADYAFPPSRGRRGITLKEGGAAETQYPGPTDRTARAEGHWSLEGKRLTIDAHGWSGSYEIESADKDMIVLHQST